MSNQYPLFTLRTQEIAGRRDLLARLEQARRKITTADAGTHLFYLIGKGGMGKTRILEELRDAQPPLDNQRVTAIIDFYETANHSSINLQEAIVNKLPQDENTKQVFAEYRRQLQSFRNIAASGMGDERQRKRLGEAFLAAWRTYTEQRSVVILLDTAELLQFQDDEVRAKLNLPLPEANSKSWLFTAIAENKLPRTLFVIAGRPRSKLDDELHKLSATHANIVIYQLERLNHEECNEYFDHLARTLAEAHPEQAEEIAQLPYSLRHRLFYLTDGRPIALALALQLYLSNIGGKFRDLVEQADAHAPENQEALRNALMQGIMYEAFGDIGLLLRIMPITRRGLTPQLLGVLLKGHRTEEEWAQMIEDLKAQIFVKTRPDGSIVLHDEIADWAEHELYADDQVTARRLYQKVADYYHDLFRGVRTEIHDRAVETNHFLEENTAENGAAQSSQFADVYKPLLKEVERRRRIAIDRLFYALRADPLDGYKYYYELAEEAFNVNLNDYDAQIHSVFLQWWDAKDEIGRKEWQYRHAAGEAGITEAVVNSDLAVRWVQRQFNQEGLPAKQATIDLVKQAIAAKIGNDPVTRHKLDTYAITAKGQVGLDDTAAAKVKRAFTTNLSALHRLMNEYAVGTLGYFLASDALAFAHYEAGFFQLFTFGHYEEAIDHFTNSVRLYKDLRFEINRARSLNDRAYALARAGELERAILSINDALDLRIELGLARVAALSLNTKGIIHVYQFKPNTALALCERALNIFEQLEDKWGQMLACLALSEANRRKADADGVKLNEKLDSLDQAEKFSDRCFTLANELQVSPAQRAEILNEYACALRDQAKFLSEHSRLNAAHNVDDLWRRASAKLEEALDIVQESKHLSYLAMDCRTDQAYLAYYRGDIQEAGNYLDEALKLEPEAERRKTPSNRYKRNLNYRIQMAKIYTLKARISGDALNELPNDAPQDETQRRIDDFVRDAVLTLFYIAGIPDYRQTRNARRQIYDQLRALSLPVLDRLSEVAKQTEKGLGLSSSSTSQHGLHAFIKQHYGEKMSGGTYAGR